MLLAPLPPPTELIVGRINVDRREFWCLSSAARPRCVLSERITPKLVETGDPSVRYVAQPNDLARCALSPRGDRLLLVDGQDWEGKRLVVRLSEWSMTGRRLRAWRYEGLGAEPIYAGYDGDRPALLLVRQPETGASGLDLVGVAHWGDRRDHPVARAGLPAFLRLLPASADGLAPDWTLATPGWMPVGLTTYTFDGPDSPFPGVVRHRRLRLLWHGVESRWRAEDLGIVGPATVALPAANASLTQLVQVGPNALAAVIVARSLAGPWAPPPFKHPQEVWWLSTEGKSPRWSALVDGEWIAVRKEGDGWPLRWPESDDPERFPLSESDRSSRSKIAPSSVGKT